MKKTSLTVSILGAGNMGTAIAQLVANNGYQVKLWNYEGDQEPLDQISSLHENKKYLPGIKLSSNIIAEKNLQQAVTGSKIIFFVLPSNCIGAIIKCSLPFISPQTICVDVSKGLEEQTLNIVTDIMQKKLPRHSRSLVTSISGPAIAIEMVQGGFTAMNIASKDKTAIALVKKVLTNDNLRLKETTDMIGMEIGGSLKNIYAIALGICDHYGWTMNTKSAIVVLALQEISNLIKKMGGKETTAFDLSGLGDLVCTALSPHSRNRRFGEILPKHDSKESAAQAVGQVVEGINACKLAVALSKKYKIKMPLAQTVYNIVWKKDKADDSLKKILKSI